MIITLVREAYLPNGTLGMLQVNGRKFPTLENPRSTTDRHDACLPAGTYRMYPRQRASGEKAYVISNPQLNVWERPLEVPPSITDARSAVFLAAGVSLDDLVGSHIAPGKNRSQRSRVWQLDASREAMNEIRTLLGNALVVTLCVEDVAEMRAAQ